MLLRMEKSSPELLQPLPSSPRLAILVEPITTVTWGAAVLEGRSRTFGARSGFSSLLRLLQEGLPSPQPLAEPSVAVPSAANSAAFSMPSRYSSTLPLAHEPLEIEALSTHHSISSSNSKLPSTFSPKPHHRYFLHLLQPPRSPSQIPILPCHALSSMVIC